jgi:hypothetical protein
MDAYVSLQADRNSWARWSDLETGNESVLQEMSAANHDSM